jgi:hypothetical protein
MAKKAKPPGRPVGRPKIQIDPIQVEKLARLHCSTAEIAAFFDCSTDTIERNFAAILVKGRESGKRKLRRLQWKAAEKGNTALLIWLGKQILGQTEKIEEKLESKVEAEVVVYQAEFTAPPTDET